MVEVAPSVARVIGMEGDSKESRVGLLRNRRVDIEERCRLEHAILDELHDPPLLDDKQPRRIPGR